MKNVVRFASMLVVAVFAFSFSSCDDNDEIAVIDPNAGFDAVLDVKEGGTINPNINVTVDANTTVTIKAKVTFTTTTKNMTRLYITQNVKAEGETIFKPTESVDLKGDGSIDLTGKNSKNFEFQFALPVPSGVGTGTVVYSFWTTDGTGDFRDKTKRLALGTGTITLRYGAATNPDAPLKSFSAKILAAPLADGSSESFISLLDGKLYKINAGAEYAAYWDFGYHFTNANGAALASTSNYEATFSFVDVDGIAGTTELNNTFFALSTLTSAQFDAATKAGELTFTKPAEQHIYNLVAGNIVQFVDHYGKKGLIRIVEVKGTFNSGDYIKIDIKVQP